MGNLQIVLFILCPLCLSAAKLNYDVQFSGVKDPIVLQALENSSELISLQNRPPASMSGLHYRAKADIPNLLKILRAYAYYDAEISYEIRAIGSQLVIDLFINTGPRYYLGSYELFRGNCIQPFDLACCGVTDPERLGLKIGEPADSLSIVRAETEILNQLARCGYPLSYIDKRRVIVDMKEKRVDAAACVQEGPLARFGPVTFFGLKNVNPGFIDRKLAWQEGEIFNSDLVDETQRRLLKTDLFSSVLITHTEELDDAGELAMKVRLSEAKPRSISLGVFYATVDGPGGTISWVNRNFRNVGDQLSIEADGSKRFIAGTVLYRKPDFRRINQQFSALGEVSRENIHAYLAFTYRESNRIERRIDPHRTVSIGLKGEYISVHDSANNGIFFLLGLPLYGNYTTADSPLDPTSGWSLSYLITPYQSLRKSGVHFVKQKLTANFYLPFAENKRAVLAIHAQFGSIAGAPQDDVPLPKLFLGGSEDDLRGYAYKTVSPLNERGDPLGGRSAIFTTVELRFRVTKSLGLVPFADFGTVTLNETPQINAKWFKSIGGGVRYYTFFGPLRLDVGFPLNPRKGLDTWGKIYASIGQSF